MIDKYLEDLHQDYGYMLGNLLGYVCDGWMQLIRDMLQEIDTKIETDVEAGDYPVFTDIKEKYGTLRVYGYNISDETEEIIAKYARLSGETCMTCGAPGKMREKGHWLYVACDQHEEKV